MHTHAHMQATPEEADKILHVLDKCSSWDFDIFLLNEVTNGRALQTMGWTLLHRYDLVQKFRIDEAMLKAWLVKVESMYKDNPYHNGA